MNNPLMVYPKGSMTILLVSSILFLNVTPFDIQVLNKSFAIIWRITKPEIKLLAFYSGVISVVLDINGSGILLIPYTITNTQHLIIISNYFFSSRLSM